MALSQGHMDLTEPRGWSGYHSLSLPPVADLPKAVCVHRGSENTLLPVQTKDIGSPSVDANEIEKEIAPPHP